MSGNPALRKGGPACPSGGKRPKGALAEASTSFRISKSSCGDLGISCRPFSTASCSRFLSSQRQGYWSILDSSISSLACRKCRAWRSTTIEAVKETCVKSWNTEPLTGCSVPHMLEYRTAIDQCSILRHMRHATSSERFEARLHARFLDCLHGGGTPGTAISTGKRRDRLRRHLETTASVQRNTHGSQAQRISERREAHC